MSRLWRFQAEHINRVLMFRHAHAAGGDKARGAQVGWLHVQGVQGQLSGVSVNFWRGMQQSARGAAVVFGHVPQQENAVLNLHVDLNR